MALKGLDIFKLTPKTNCKDCGNPTCMAFSMKVAAGSVDISKCPHLSEDVLAKLAESTAPPMKTIKVKVGDEEYSLGGETVLYRHEKTYVSKTLYAVDVDGDFDASVKVDYDRIGERMRFEFAFAGFKGDIDAFVAGAKKAAEAGRGVILCTGGNVEAAKAAVEAVKDAKPILNGANASNYEEMNAIAKQYGLVLGVGGETLDELYETVGKLEQLGNKELILDVGVKSIKSAFEFAVQIRRAALQGNDRTFGYPSLVNAALLAGGNYDLETALASLFTMRYGSIIVTSGMDYDRALALYGMRQNIFTDPQKPMKMEPGIYPLNGGGENDPCLITVDFALTYFVVSGELERSGVPCNLFISDAGGYSVLTAWAAGKFSAGSIANFIKEYEVENKIKSRKLILPGKVAVLKGELQDKLPGWEIIVGTSEAVALVKFLKEFVKNG